MASNESIHDQIAEAFETSLKGISGDGGTTFWDTPQAVVRMLEFDDRVLDSSLGGPHYLIRPGPEEHREESAPQVMKAQMDLSILLLRPFTTAERSVLEPANPSRWTLVNRMVRDVLRKLLQDVQLLSVGGAVDNIFEEAVIVERNRYADVEGWAIAEIHIPAIGYRYVGGVP